FLDEPTTGFDPQARRQAWEIVQALAGGGTTVLLTTHYLEEAQVLADRVVVFSRGEVVETGTPAELAARTGLVDISYRPIEGHPLPDLATDADLLTDGRWSTKVPEADVTRFIADLSGWAVRSGVQLAELNVSRPSLEDIYLALITEEQQDEVLDA
ncbi:MAG: ABC transporter ATP-binding protein, partial [Solirubrobacteraceae bacterium]|nr:ABC transporter ATP-binding protein [Solirubrobacteraceae bacterium]